MKRKSIKDKSRLNMLIQILESGGSSDFNQYLFFACKKSKTIAAGYRKALDQYIKAGY